MFHRLRGTIFRKMITANRVAEQTVFELMRAVIFVICCGFMLFEFIKAVIEKNPLRGNVCAVTDFVFSTVTDVTTLRSDSK